MHVRLFYIFSLFLFSCNNNSTSVSNDILAGFDSVSKNLERTNRLMSESNAVVKKKLLTLATTDTVSWRKIGELDDAVNSFARYTDSLSRAFVAFCGPDESGWLSTDQESDVELSTKYFIGQGNGPKFYQRLADFSEKSRAIALTDSTRSFAEELISVPRTIREAPLSPSPARFSNVFFKLVPPVAVLTIIAKFRNDAELLRSIIFDEYSKLVSSQP